MARDRAIRTSMILFCAAAVAMTAAAAAAAVDAAAGGMAVAREKSDEGTIWTGGAPTMVCVAGAIGGSFFSICFELCFSKGPVCPKRLAVKFFMQPVLALVATSPVIHFTPIPFTIDMIASVSFVIGAVGVYLITLSTPVFEKKIIPAVGRRVVKLIDPSDSSDSIPDRDDDYRPRPKPHKPPRPYRGGNPMSPTSDDERESSDPQ